MNHHVVHVLNAYIDGELSSDVAREVETHLSQCESCLEEANELRQVKEWVSEIYALEPVPNLLDESIMSEINRMKRAGHQLEFGIGFVLLSLIALFGLIHSYFNHGWMVLVAFYRITRSLILALPQLVGVPPVVTISIVGIGLLIVGITLPVLWKVLHSMALEDRRGWQ